MHFVFLDEKKIFKFQNVFQHFWLSLKNPWHHTAMCCPAMAASNPLMIAFSFRQVESNCHKSFSDKNCLSTLNILFVQWSWLAILVFSFENKMEQEPLRPNKYPLPFYFCYQQSLWTDVYCLYCFSFSFNFLSFHLFLQTKFQIYICQNIIFPFPVISWERQNNSSYIKKG